MGRTWLLMVRLQMHESLHAHVCPSTMGCLLSLVCFIDASLANLFPLHHDTSAAAFISPPLRQPVRHARHHLKRRRLAPPQLVVDGPAMVSASTPTAEMEPADATGREPPSSQTSLQRSADESDESRGATALLAGGAGGLPRESGSDGEYSLVVPADLSLRFRDSGGDVSLWETLRLEHYKNILQTLLYNYPHYRIHIADPLWANTPPLHSHSTATPTTSSSSSSRMREVGGNDSSAATATAMVAPSSFASWCYPPSMLEPGPLPPLVNISSALLSPDSVVYDAVYDSREHPSPRVVKARKAKGQERFYIWTKGMSKTQAQQLEVEALQRQDVLDTHILAAYSDPYDKAYAYEYGGHPRAASPSTGGGHGDDGSVRLSNQPSVMVRRRATSAATGDRHAGSSASPVSSESRGGRPSVGVGVDERVPGEKRGLMGEGHGLGKRGLEVEATLRFANGTLVHYTHIFTVNDVLSLASDINHKRYSMSFATAFDSTERAIEKIFVGEKTNTGGVSELLKFLPAICPLRAELIAYQCLAMLTGVGTESNLAESCALDAVRAAPNMPLAWQRLGDAYRCSRDFWKAKNAYAIALSLMPPPALLEDIRVPYEALAQAIAAKNTDHNVPALLKFLPGAVTNTIDKPSGFAIDPNPQHLGGCRVAYVVPDSPAAKAGIQAGSHLIAVGNNGMLMGKPMEHCMKQLQQSGGRGESRTKLTTFAGSYVDLYGPAAFEYLNTILMTYPVDTLAALCCDAHQQAKILGRPHTEADLGGIDQDPLHGPCEPLREDVCQCVPHEPRLRLLRRISMFDLPNALLQ